jgi:hypothetical protein
MTKKLSFLCFVQLLLAGTALAAPIAPANPHKPTTGPAAAFQVQGPVDDDALPGLHAGASGLLLDTASGALPADMWSGTSESMMKSLLPKLEVNAAWTSDPTLVRRLILSGEQWPGTKSESLRLNTMLRIGATKEAAEYYTHLAPDSPAPDLLRAGFRALVRHNQPSIACLELKAGKPDKDDSTDGFWIKADAYCRAVLAREELPDAPVTPASSGFEDPHKTPVVSAPVAAPAFSAPSSATAPEQPAPDAAVVKPGDVAQEIFDLASATTPIRTITSLTDFIALDPFLIDISPTLAGLKLDFSDWKIPDHFPADIASLLTARYDLPLALRLKLYTISADTEPPAIDEHASAALASHPAGEDIWLQVANLYRQQTTLSPEQVNAFGREVLALPITLPLRAHLLFAPTLNHLPATESLTPIEQQKLTALLLAIDSDAVIPWLKKLRDSVGDSSVHNLPASALLLLGQTRGHAAANGKFPLSFSQLVQDKHPEQAKLFRVLSELLDTEPLFIDNPDVVYDKNNALTRTYSYVIPWRDLRNHLTDAKDKRQTGKVVLASLLTLQTESPATIDPGALASVLQGLIAVGLEEDARQLATSALLGVIFTGEN